MINITNIFITNNFAGLARETGDGRAWCLYVVVVVVVVVENGKTYFPSRIKNLPFRLQTSYKSQGRVERAREYQQYHHQTQGWY